MKEPKIMDDIVLLNLRSTTYPHDNIHGVGIYENGNLKIINIKTLEVINEVNL